MSKEKTLSKFWRKLIKLTIVAVICFLGFVGLGMVTFLKQFYTFLPLSTHSTQVIFNYAGLRKWQRVYIADKSKPDQTSVLFYQDGNNTVLYHLDSGRKFSLPVHSPALFVKPDTKDYFIFGRTEGKAYLINNQGQLLHEYGFSPFTVEREYPNLTIDDETAQFGETGRASWLDNNRLLTMNGTFDFSAGIFTYSQDKPPSLLTNYGYEARWVGGRSNWQRYPEKIDKKTLPNGSQYEMTSDYVPSFDSPAKTSSTLKTFDSQGQSKGTIYRHDIQVISEHWHGENQLLLLSEKGLEVVKY